VRPRNNAAAATALTAASTGDAQRVESYPDHLVVSGVTDGGWISEMLGRRDIWVTELTPLAPDLESVFLTLTGTTPEPGQRRQVDDSVQPPPSADVQIDLDRAAVASTDPGVRS
jgi:ABC-2 type transport system ATP-binding protein